MTAPDIITSISFPPAFQKAGGFKVVWNPPDDSVLPPATSYQVGVAQGDPTVSPITVVAPTTSIIIKGLLANTLYNVWVRPLNGSDAGEWTHTNRTTNVDTGTRPRFAEFIHLRTITEKWVQWENVDGSDDEQDIIDGGGPNG